MTDQELYDECKKWGKQALHARWKFAGLLPEVNRRALFKRKGFETIYDFARILAGMSRNQVNRVLQLDRKFEDKPELREMLVEGKASVNKLAKVAAIATQENQSELSEKVQTLSTRAIETFAKESKETQNPNGLFETSEAVHVNNIDQPNIDFEIINAMSPELKSKIKELMDKGQDINHILLEMISKRENEIEEKMEQIDVKPAKNRYINVKTRRIVTEKFGRKCAKTGCNKSAEQIHHEKHFSQYHTHDPLYLKPLCKAHHELAHEKDAGVHKFRRLAFV